ncbi:MAG: DUF2817 domain-containing protein [Deltaproteobacteria bacterium]|nr:MAG: DUF2817 domain-containing protein [Deltaproteobacteria bacterium]
MQTTQHFSADYTEARRRFLEAASMVGADVESFQNPSSGQSPGKLFTDVASLGPEDAENILVLMSGTHGVEGFGGSGIQTGLLCEGIAESLGPDTRLVMIHALNPYGFAELRRFNEDNVDLNRNFVDHSEPYPENLEYDQLTEVIAPRSLSFQANLFFLLRVLWYRLCQGSAKLQQAVTFGQYSHPDGLFYGGRCATWSNRILHEITERYLTRAARVVIIDVHTGLGPYGDGEVILNNQVDDPAYQRAVSWWGEECVKSTVSGEAVSAHLSGTINLAFTRMLPDTEVTSVGLEFGTLPPMAVFKAIRAENWLHHHGGTVHHDAAKIKQQFLQAFYPDDDLWKQKIWEQGRLVVEQALANL